MNAHVPCIYHRPLTSSSRSTWRANLSKILYSIDRDKKEEEERNALVKERNSWKTAWSREIGKLSTSDDLIKVKNTLHRARSPFPTLGTQNWTIKTRKLPVFFSQFRSLSLSWYIFPSLSYFVLFLFFFFFFFFVVLNRENRSSCFYRATF